MVHLDWKLGLGIFFFAVTSASACSVGQKVLVEPGDHAGTVLNASTGGSCRVHFDNPALADDWIPPYNLKAADADARNNATVAHGPRLGRYDITVGTGFYDGYFVLQSAAAYELFLPGGKSAGTGQYAFDASQARLRWLSGPLANHAWDGTQKLEASGTMLKVRIGARAVATNTGP